MSKGQERNVKRMEGKLITSNKFDLDNLKLNERKSVSNFLEHINNQRKRYKRLILIKGIICFILYWIFLEIYEYLEVFFQDYFLTSVWISWITLVVFILILYLIFRTNAKMSPTLLKFIEKQLEEFNLDLKRRTKYIYYYLLLNSLSIIIMGMIFFTKFSIPSTLNSFYYGFLIFCLIYPLLIGAKKDKYFVNLKGDYEIEFNFRGKALKLKNEKVLTIGIYMISNPLCFKWESSKTSILNEISNKHWLPKSGRFQIIPFSVYSYFYEYATVLNFEERFLNLSLAVKEWDDELH